MPSSRSRRDSGPTPNPPFSADSLLDAVCRASADYIVVVDRSYRIRFVNRVGKGFTDQEVLGADVTAFTTVESRDRLRVAIDASFRTGERQTVDTVAHNTDGSTTCYRVSIAPVRLEDGAPAAVLCSEDITLWRLSEEQRQRDQAILRRLLEIQERERQLVSYEIHDGVVQYIAGAIMHLEAARHAHPGIRDLEEGIRLAQAAADETRRLIGGLRPPALDELGIVSAIDSLVADARLEIPTVDFTHTLPVERLPDAVETTLFRIVQESLTNVRKHARATSASVSLVVEPQGIRVRITDNGRGFDPTQVPAARFGLEGIRQRCRVVGAEPIIDSTPGRGTRVEALLPINDPTT